MTLSHPDGPMPRGGDKLAAMRRDYGSTPLVEADLAADPMTQFARWFDDAAQADLPEPNAFVLATADAEGRPSSRTVLLKRLGGNSDDGAGAGGGNGDGDGGFVFFTNYGSRKATEIAVNAEVSMLFPWYAIKRQVIVCGTAERVTRAESAEYFASRPRGSRLGAWASRQSEVVASRKALDEQYARIVERFGEDESVPVPLPDFWGGIRVLPRTVEFWQGRSDRMHDRLRYGRSGGGWAVERLNP